MRAVVVERYGPPEVARVQEVPVPQPGAGEVLLRVLAAAVTSGDARMRSGVFPPGFALPARLAIGIRGPRRSVLGAVYAGEVEALGSGVTVHAVGDRVAGMSGFTAGGHAEFVIAKAENLAPIPGGLGFDAAAAVLFGGSTALDFLRDKAALAAGQTVLVNGASGAVGSAAVQLARHNGAEVTAVTSAANADFARRLGASRVIDYRTTSVTGLADAGERFDVVLDTVGTLTPKTGKPLLTENGVLLLAVASLGDTIAARGQVKAGTASEKVENLREVLRLAADGVLDPLIETVLPLERIAEAYRRIDSGRKVGNIVVRPGE